MSALVALQSTVLTKLHLAHIAFLRFLVRVNTHVDFQLTRCTKLHLAHFTLIRFLVRVNAHVDFQRIRITKTLLAHIALVLPSLSLHSFRSGNNKSLWHVMMILLHHDIFIVFTRTATAHPQQPKLFVSLFFFSSSPLLFLITFQNRLYVYRSFRMWILSSSSHYIVAFILSSLLLLLRVRVLVAWSVAHQSERPLFLFGPKSLRVFFSNFTP